jgi:hypothetical protein
MALVTAGMGFHTVSVAVPVNVGAATLTAVMVTGLVAGIAAGGVYSPLVEIVPSVVDPPTTPFTCQVTPVLASLLTVAVNWAVEPSLTWPAPLTVT